MSDISGNENSNISYISASSDINNAPSPGTPQFSLAHVLTNKQPPKQAESNDIGDSVAPAVAPELAKHEQAPTKAVPQPQKVVTCVRSWKRVFGIFHL